MSNLPSGTLTFLFTDIEGSTRLWESDPDRMRLSLARHDELVESTVSAHGGLVFKHTGDGVCAVFVSGPDALRAAVAVQLALDTEPWTDGPRVKARMGIHTGHAEPVGDDYFGTPLNRCARVMSAGHGGQILCTAATAAIATQLAGITLRDLGRHRLRDLAEPQHLYQVASPGLAETFPPLRALDAHRHNLPIPRTSFVGRERELEELNGALQGSRIVTVTGVGGSGKTRLTLQAAAEAVHQYRDGVYLVELASVIDSAELAPRLGEVVGVPLLAGQAMQPSPAEMVQRYLEDKEMLVILDNCEHLLDACAAFVEEILSAAEGVRVIATSREPLGLDGEHVMRIPSLGLADNESSVEAVVTSESGQLFTDRAIAGRSDFAVTPANARTVDQICRRLDGIPLAIELAAARLRHMSIQQVADRLDDRFRLLTGGGRTALPRQQTLLATLDWSHDLLSDTERTLFRRLSIFVGGFSLDAVEGICTGGGIDDFAVIDLLGRLVDRSLVVVGVDSDDSETVYHLLETMRHYAQQKVLDAGETETLRDRHRDWYAATVDISTMVAAPYGFVPIALHVQGNARAALEWALATDAHDAAYRLMAYVAPSWVELGSLDEASTYISQVLARPWSTSVTRERSWLLTAGAIYANLRNDFAGGLEYAEAARSLALEHEITDLLPHIFEAMAIASAVVGSIAEGEQLMERAASASADLGFRTLSSMIWMQLAGLRLGHDPEQGRAAAEQAVAIQPDPTAGERIRALGTLAFACLVTRDLTGAAAAVEEMDTITGDAPLDAWADLEGIVPRAAALAAIERSGEARSELREALEAVSRLEVPLTETAYLVAFAAVEAFGGDPQLALVLLGASRRRFQEERAWRTPIVGAVYVQSVAQARSAVSEDIAKKARSAGFELANEEVLALVAP